MKFEESTKKYNDFFFVFSILPVIVGVGCTILLQYILPANFHRFVSLAIGAFVGGATPFIINNIAANRKGQPWIAGFHHWLNQKYGHNFMKTLRGIVGVIYIAAVSLLCYGLYKTFNP